MFRNLNILLTAILLFTFSSSFGEVKKHPLCFDFYDGTFSVVIDSSILIKVSDKLSTESAVQFYNIISAGNYKPLLDSLIQYKNEHQLNDWLYYQLIRKTAQEISPKEQNYYRYTFYKWFMLYKSGYDARLATADDKLIFYVFNDEDISDIPFFMVGDKKYMCLNYHDYAKVDINSDPPKPIDLPVAEHAFSYKVTRMPDFKPGNYSEKDLKFSYGEKVYHFKVKLNTAVQTIFANYPGVDFESYFNIPLSKETYGSLIPLLKKNVKNLGQKNGVDYLMRFTRYAFLYEDDEENFGKEKRLSPEQTLFSAYSDCDDRAALFFYLVKEIYNLPMVALLYPTHITMAVQFDKPVGNPIVYNGKLYSVCEATPQAEDLAIGQLSAKLINIPYQVVYHYEPAGK